MYLTYQHFPVLAVMSQFLGAFIIGILGGKRRNFSKAVAFITSAFSLVLVALLIKPVFLNGEIISYWMGGWEPVDFYAIGIGYEVDRLGLFFAILVVLIIFCSVLYSLRYLEHDDCIDRYYTLFLMLSGSLLGITMTGDIFNMFIMIEIMTFTAVGLTCFRNGIPEALEAGFKYLVIGSVGSSMILAGIALIYAQCRTLNIAQLTAMLTDRLYPGTILAFALMFIGFGVKSFIVPFHTPVADAHPVAPTSFSMVFSTVVIKCGIYGMIRMAYMLFSVMDQSAVQILITAFGTITMFVGAVMAISQKDFKRLLAYSSISQIGYIITALGLGTALGLTGALFHTLNHTLFKALLFMCAGCVLHMTGSKNLDELGGLHKRMPQTTVLFIIGMSAIAGLPPFNGFASKWIIYQAAYTKAVQSGNFFYAVVTVAAVVVSVMTLAYFIKVTQSVFFGPLPEKFKDTKEAPKAMLLPMWILAALCVVTGVCYNFVDKFLLNPAVGAALGATKYVNTMMGEGYAQIFGVRDIASGLVKFSYWNPVLWLILFAIVILAVFIVVLTGETDRGQVLTSEDDVDGKYSTFFGGEKFVYSHMGGSDMFWGLKKSWKGFFEFMETKHSGIVTDYTTWVLVAATFIVAFAFKFVR